MSVRLNRDVTPVVLPDAKVAKVVHEANVEHWIEIWVTYGTVIEGVFVEWRDPVTGDIASPKFLKIEDGNHPLKPGTGLFECKRCHLWYQTSADCPSCGRGVDPYDGYTRLAVRGKKWSLGSDEIDRFLTNEEVPDPGYEESVWNDHMVKLLDGTEV